MADDRRTIEDEEKLASIAAAENWRLEHQGKAVDLSKEGLRTLILLNGAAAIAIMALIGQIVEKMPSAIMQLSHSIMYFVSGALVGGLSTIGAYVTQYFIGESQENPAMKRASKWAHIITLLLVALGYVAFIGGAFTAALEIPTLGTSSNTASIQE